MKLIQQTLAKTLLPAYRVQNVEYHRLQRFKTELARLLEHLEHGTGESEEHLKNLVSDFLKAAWYRDEHFVNTKDRQDLVIHNGRTAKDSVCVIIEAKRPKNKGEMITPDKPNTTALHELLRYYLNERSRAQNKEIRHLIITDIHHWYIFDAADFERHIYANTKLLQQYTDWHERRLGSIDTGWFYKEIAAPFFEKELPELRCCTFDLRDYAAAQPIFPAAAIGTLSYEGTLSEYIRTNAFAVNLGSLSDSGWTLTDQSTQNLLDKLRAAGTPLGEYVEGKIYYGIKTGLNEAFVIDTATRARLIAKDPKSPEVIKPFLAGRDIKRYQTPVSDKYLIFTRRGIKIEEYPAILAHLEQFKDRLMPKPKGYSGDWAGRKEGTYQWYEIQDAVDYFEEFEKAKLVIPAIIKRPEIIIDPNDHYSNDKTTLVATDDLFVLGVLNSNISDIFMQNISSTKQNGYFEYKPVYISQIPIPHANSAQNDKITALVTRILSVKRADPQGDTSVLEAEVDMLVYGLYGLTEAEIAVVAGRQ